MTKLTKNQKFALEKLDKDKLYTLKEASSLVKDMTKTKFDASIDLDVRLGIDPRKSNQMVRGVVSLLMEQEKRHVYSCSALPIRRLKLKKPELISLVLTTLLKRSKVVGQIWML